MSNRAVRVQGVECPMFREGDDLVDGIVRSVLQTDELNDKDIVGITESVVARTAGQYINVDDIADDIRGKFGDNASVCLVNPIYSRNRFSMILKGMARACRRLSIIMPEFDEVGNPSGVNPFTGVNIADYYRELCCGEGCGCSINEVDPDCDGILYCGLHDTVHSESLASGMRGIPGFRGEYFTLADVCSDASPDWGVLGTNKATEERLKLFPSRELCNRICSEIKAELKKRSGKDVIVCVYGDGCFKDPVGGIWEFADPVTMPGYTDAEILESTPNELKIKYLLDSKESNDEITTAISRQHSEGGSLVGQMASQGTTPRLYRDLLASLMDLTSGSGDRATPVVLVQNYF